MIKGTRNDKVSMQLWSDKIRYFRISVLRLHSKYVRAKFEEALRLDNLDFEKSVSDMYVIILSVEWIKTFR